MITKTLEKKSFLSLILYGTRPKTLVASFFPVILGMLLARYDGFYDISIYLYTLLAAIFLQIGTNYANDYFDNKAGRDTKNRLGPGRVGSLGLLSKEVILSVMITSFIVSCILTIPLIEKGGYIILYLIAVAIFLGISYSWGTYSLANTGLSNAVVFFVFGPIGTLMTYYLQSGTYEIKAAFFGILPGCLSLMLFAMNNLRDMEEDRLSNKKTLVVRFGFNWGKKEYIGSMFIAWIIPPIGMMLYGAGIVTLLPLILLKQGVQLSQKVYQVKNSLDIVPLFAETAKYNTLYALLYIIGWRIAAL